MTQSDVSPSATAPAPATFTGRLTANPKGFAFVHLADGLPDVFIPPKARLSAQQGEVVRIVIEEETEGRRSGRVVSLPDRAPEWVGEVITADNGSLLLKPLDQRLPLAALLPGPAIAGQLILARLDTRPTYPRLGEVSCVRVLGQEPSAQVINEIVALGHQLPGAFTDEDLASIATDTSPGDRTDLRHLPFVTIDAAHSRDLDDALWAEPMADGRLRMIVAIADVAHFVRPGTRIDELARERTTSVYLPGRVLPMLPNLLSQELCSLNPAVDRLCVVCDLIIEADGQVLQSRFYRAHMRSQGRLTYDGVEQHLFNGVPAPTEWAPVWSSLQALRQCYERLLDARRARGAIDFDSAEASVSVGPDGATFVRQPRGHAHRLVEETMVAANVQAARTLDERAHDSLFRAHAAPPPKKREALDALLDARAIERPDDSPGAMAALARAHPTLAPAILRAQDKASYQTRNAGHFGLGLAHYAHFTSPIRRYPDLVIHRVLLGEAQPDLEELARLCSEGERRATIAEREAVDRLRAAHMAPLAGQRFTGRIESVTRMGLFITLDESRASGLLPLAALGEALADVLSQVITDGDGVEWGLGETIEVALASADWKTNRLEFAAPRHPTAVPAVAAGPRP